MPPALYPSWIEIPVVDLDRATAFYSDLFGLTETFEHAEAEMRVVVLRASDKANLQPGVSLVASPLHQPCRHGVQVNFHIGDHAALKALLLRLTVLGGQTVTPLNITKDGVQYVSVLDSEGNTFALSSYDPE